MSSGADTSGKRPKVIDELVMLAVLAGPADQPLVAKVGRCWELGWNRFNVLALAGNGAEPDESGDEVLACDVERAKQGWQAVKGVMAQRRFHYGVDAATLTPSGLPLTFDLETRWCLQVRAAHEHPDTNVVFDADVFPFR